MAPTVCPPLAQIPTNKCRRHVSQAGGHLIISSPLIMLCNRCCTVNTLVTLFLADYLSVCLSDCLWLCAMSKRLFNGDYILLSGWLKQNRLGRGGGGGGVGVCKQRHGPRVASWISVERIPFCVRDKLQLQTLMRLDRAQRRGWHVTTGFQDQARIAKEGAVEQRLKQKAAWLCNRHTHFGYCLENNGGSTEAAAAAATAEAIAAGTSSLCLLNYYVHLSHVGNMWLHHTGVLEKWKASPTKPTHRMQRPANETTLHTMQYIVRPASQLLYPLAPCSSSSLLRQPFVQMNSFIL